MRFRPIRLYSYGAGMLSPINSQSPSTLPDFEKKTTVNKTIELKADRTP
jgi:hypothetical protein